MQVTCVLGQVLGRQFHGRGEEAPFFPFYRALVRIVHTLKGQPLM